MKKRILSIVLLMCFMAIMISSAALALDEPATSGSCGENLTWSFSEDGTLTISGDGAMDDYSNNSTNRSPWDSYRYKIEKVVFNGEPINIGNNAFYSCENLTDVNIPDSVTRLGECSFFQCRSLNDVTIPNSVTSIEKNAFGQCIVLADVTISNGLTSIEDFVFYNCALTSVTIPEGVKIIKGSAFDYCDSLQDIFIPASVIRLGDAQSGKLFSRCENLNAINVAPENKFYSSYNGVLFDKKGETLICCPEGKTTFEIPDNVVEIGEYAFENCTHLSQMIIPDSVTNIGERAFYYCTKLSNITIPENVQEIGWNVFSNCTSLQKIEFPDFFPEEFQLRLEHCFNNCTSLTSITVPEGVIGLHGTFTGCTKLTSISLPFSLETITSNTFNGCINLQTVTYAGTKEQWNTIEIRNGNQELLLAELICIGDDPNQPTEPDKDLVVKYTRGSQLSSRDKRTYFGGKLQIRNPNDAEKTYYISIGSPDLKVEGKALSITYVETLSKNESFVLPCQSVFRIKIYEIPKDQDLSVGFDLGDPVLDWTPVTDFENWSDKGSIEENLI